LRHAESMCLLQKLLSVQSVGVMRNAGVVLPAQNESRRVGLRPPRFD
jgi:hypothetical protein